MSTQSGTSLQSYLRSQYGGKTQTIVATLGKELQRCARFSNPHHFTLRCYKSGLVPPSLRVKAPVKTDRARNAAMRTSKVFVQERIKTSWRAKEAALSNVEKCRSGLHAAVSEVDFDKVTSLCERTAQKGLGSAKTGKSVSLTNLERKSIGLMKK